MRNWMRALGFLLLAFALPGGCDSERQVSDADVKFAAEDDYTAATMGGAGVLIDVRSIKDYNEGHLPAAISIPLPELTGGDARLMNAKKIFVYDRGMLDGRATAAVKKMLVMGYSEVYEIQGGFRLWQTSGKQIIKNPGAEQIRPETKGN